MPASPLSSPDVVRSKLSERLENPCELIAPDVIAPSVPPNEPAMTALPPPVLTLPAAVKIPSPLLNASCASTVGVCACAQREVIASALAATSEYPNRDLTIKPPDRVSVVVVRV